MVRQEVSKGSFKDVNVREICKMISEHDISIISNYIVGFPEDTYETMTSTLNLALELNTEMMNVYPCQALPGSKLYINGSAGRMGTNPEKYEEFAFLSYECKPLPTKHLSNKEVLGFRDYFWQTYFRNPAYLDKVELRFGRAQRLNVEEMAKHQLKRKILE